MDYTTSMMMNKVDKQMRKAIRKHPGFLDLICKAIERQQKDTPRTPEELQTKVLGQRMK